ncbi:MAG: hypothetical protein QM662_13305 [Gordonia sp. (in: high G+C Gram-positive bacteria)]
MAVHLIHARTAVWWVLTTVVLVVRLTATLATTLSAIAWAVAAAGDSPVNPFLWAALVSGVALLVSTYVYGPLRASYPRRNGWQP